MTLAMHEISESRHRVLNPITVEQVQLLGRLTVAEPGTRVLDLACGKGELLCQWSTRLGATGLGVDISPVFLAAARLRAAELGVANRIEFVEADAGDFRPEPAQFGIGCCIGATWIGNGVPGTIELLRPAVVPGGLLLIGEPYWISAPPDDAYPALGVGRDEFVDLPGLERRFASAGMEIVEMVLADGSSWDRYAAAQWWTLRVWLDEHPDDPRRREVREFLDSSRSGHLAFGRQFLGWGVFVLRER